MARAIWARNSLRQRERVAPLHSAPVIYTSPIPLSLRDDLPAEALQYMSIEAHMSRAHGGVKTSMWADMPAEDVETFSSANIYMSKGSFHSDAAQGGSSSRSIVAEPLTVVNYSTIDGYIPPHARSSSATTNAEYVSSHLRSVTTSEIPIRHWRMQTGMKDDGIGSIRTDARGLSVTNLQNSEAAPHSPELSRTYFPIGEPSRTTAVSVEHLGQGAPTHSMEMQLESKAESDEPVSRLCEDSTVFMAKVRAIPRTSKTQIIPRRSSVEAKNTLNDCDPIMLLEDHRENASMILSKLCSNSTDECDHFGPSTPEQPVDESTPPGQQSVPIIQVEREREDVSVKFICNHAALDFVNIQAESTTKQVVFLAPVEEDTFDWNVDPKEVANWATPHWREREDFWPLYRRVWLESLPQENELDVSSELFTSGEGVASRSLLEQPQPYHSTYPTYDGNSPDDLLRHRKQRTYTAELASLTHQARVIELQRIADAPKSPEPEIPRDPNAPTTPCYIRPAATRDAGGIAAIHNYYARSSPVLGVSTVTIEDIRKDVEVALNKKIPYIVMVLGSSPDYVRNCPLPKETIIGFAAIGMPQTMPTRRRRVKRQDVTVQLHLFTHYQYRRKGIARSLLDRILGEIAYSYEMRGGYQAYDAAGSTAIAPFPPQRGKIQHVVIERLVYHEDDSDIAWLTTWLIRHDFAAPTLRSVTDVKVNGVAKDVDLATFKFTL